jgi:hypothetical protein
MLIVDDPTSTLSRRRFLGAAPAELSLMMQCAAVRTTSGAIRLPEQKWRHFERNLVSLLNIEQFKIDTTKENSEFSDALP